MNETQPSMPAKKMARWSSLSDDPNAPEVTGTRFRILQQRRSAALVKDRVAYLTEAVAGKRVLDIGVVAHTLEAVSHPGWLHGHLRRSATVCVGCDILPESVEFLRCQGFDVRLADLTVGPLPEKFDVIVAGEVLEHLSAPGRLLESCAAMLTPGGRLYVTVPNPWYINIIAKNLTGRSLYIDSADHVVWYDPNSLYELGQRCGLEMVSWAGIEAGRPASLAGKLVFGSMSVLTGLGLAPELFAKSLLYEFASA